MNKPDPKPSADSAETSASESRDITAVEIQRAREAMGLSVVELGRATGISKTVIHGYERGRTKPGARELRLLSAALRVSPNRLLLGTDAFENERPTFTALYRKMRTRTGLINVMGMIMFPIAASLLDEHEAQSILTLVDSLIRAKDAEAGERIALMAQVMAEALDEMTDENGQIRQLSPEDMQRLQADVMKRLDAAPPTDAEK